MSPTVALDLTDVTAGYNNGRDVIRSVSFTLPGDSALILVGPNGSGKSTILKTIVGLAALRSGRVTAFKQDLGPTTPAAAMRLGLAYVPQRLRVFADMSVLENLELALLSVGRNDRAKRLDETFGLFPILADRRSRRAGTLSGGEQQIVAIARGLIARPRLLILDEPTWGLSNKNRTLVAEHLIALRGSGISLLIAEHNVRWGASICPSFVAVKEGLVVDQGRTADLLDDNARAKAIFL